VNSAKAPGSAAAPGAAPQRVLGPMHATGIVIGAIVGVGIFFTPAKVAAIAGSAWGAMGLWALGGGIALAGAFAFAEIGKRYAESGGELVALRKMWGPLPAFLFGWSLIGAIQTGVLALIALFGARNLAVAFGVEWSGGATQLAASVIIALLAAINLAGVRPGAWIQTATSAVKLGLLAGLALLAAYVMVVPRAAAGAGAATMPASEVPWLAGLAATLFSYGGFHQLTWVGGEVRRPERTIPIAILLGVGLVIFGYLAANAAYFQLLPAAEVARSNSVAADAIASIFPALGRFTALALCVSAIGIANSQVLTAPRAYFALARDGLFPSRLAQLDARRGVPNAAILTQAGLAIAMLWLAGSDSLDKLTTGVVFLDWIFHMIAAAGLLRVASAASRGARIAALAFVIGAGVGLGATFFDPAVRSASLIGCGWIALGCVVFYAAVRPRLRAGAGK
jgi:APA family basic amino acid/polyamine antiporter